MLNTINNYKVECSGFEIIESVPEKKALLELETGLRGNHGLTLKYNYQGTNINSNEPSNSFTFFEKTEGNFIFRKYNRDFDWEKQCRVTLGEFGFFSEDDINFYPVSTDSKRKDDLYAILELVNSNYSEITNSGFILTSRLDLNFNLKPIDIEISSQIVNDWFDLRATVKIGEWEIPFSRFCLLYTSDAADE